MSENNQKYGFVEDLDKFVETQGQEGIKGQAVEKPAVEKPAVEKPAVEKPAVEKPAVEKPAVEKPAVEKPAFKVEESAEYIALKKQLDESPKLNPQLKEIQEWAEKTNRPIQEWINFQSDPKEMSDMEVVRKIQQLENPTLSKEELDFYIEDKFISDEDLDSESEIMRKKIALKQAVESGKSLLEKDRLNLSTPTDASLTEEQKQDILFAQQAKEDKKLSKESNEKYLENLRDAIKATDAIQLPLSDDKNISFNIAPESKKDQDVYIGEMKRWENEDGTVNSKVLLEDSYKLKHFDEIIKLAYSQGKNDQVESSAKASANLSGPDKNRHAPVKSGFGFVGRSANKRYQV